MSRLTLALMGRRPGRSGVWQSRLASATLRLRAAYGVPSLGNFRDPVQEIFYIALSARTADVQYRRTHRALRQRFPTLADLGSARLADVATCVADGGLVRKRAGQMRGIARALLALGARPARTLRAMTAETAYDFLSHLPGLGPKSAFCVMMYSLDFDVFPVDVHVRRVLTRMGALPAGLKHYQAQERAPALVPDRVSRDLHIGLVVLGRTVCRPLRPSCEACPIRDLCRTGRKRATNGQA